MSAPLDHPGWDRLLAAVRAVDVEPGLRIVADNAGNVALEPAPVGNVLEDVRRALVRARIRNALHDPKWAGPSDLDHDR